MNEVTMNNVVKSYQIPQKYNLTETKSEQIEKQGYSSETAGILTISNTAKTMNYQSMLSELGFCEGNSSDLTQFKKGLHNFQRVYKLAQTDLVNNATAQKLNEVYDVYKKMYNSNALSNYCSKNGMDDSEKKNFANTYAFMKIGLGLNANQIAGFMGNLQVESRFSTDNAQDINGVRIDHDKNYAYNNNDGRGYGLAQWTHSSRKELLQKTSREMGVSVSNIGAQFETIRREMNGEFKSTYDILKKTNNLSDATKLIFDNYEKANNSSLNERVKRAQDIRFVINEGGTN